MGDETHWKRLEKRKNGFTWTLEAETATSYEVLESRPNVSADGMLEKELLELEIRSRDEGVSNDRLDHHAAGRFTFRSGCQDRGAKEHEIIAERAQASSFVVLTNVEEDRGRTKQRE